MREENCYVAFVDVLGFKELVAKEKNERKISSYFDVCEAMITYWQKVEDKSSFGKS